MYQTSHLLVWNPFHLPSFANFEIQAGLATCPTLVLLSIMGNRMLLNLREEDSKSLAGSATSQLGPGEGLRFATSQRHTEDHQDNDSHYEMDVERAEVMEE